MQFFLSLLAELPQEIGGQNYNYFEEFINMMITLGVLLGFAIATLFVVKKIMRSKFNAAGTNIAIKIVEKRPLNPKASLYLVEILGKKVVIAESPQGIQLITEIPQELTAVEPTFEESKENPKISFKELMQNKIGTMFFNGKR